MVVGKSGSLIWLAGRRRERGKAARRYRWAFPSFSWFERVRMRCEYELFFIIVVAVVVVVIRLRFMRFKLASLFVQQTQRSVL